MCIRDSSRAHPGRASLHVHSRRAHPGDADRDERRAWPDPVARRHPRRGLRPHQLAALSAIAMPAQPTCPLDLSFPCIMGVVNVTPDSFSDGGRFFAADAALAQGLALVREGAALVDIGGESARPGSDPVSEDEELRRVLPVVEALAGHVGVPISVDTMKAGCLLYTSDAADDLTRVDLGGAR